MNREVQKCTKSPGTRVSSSAGGSVSGSGHHACPVLAQPCVCWRIRAAHDLTGLQISLLPGEPCAYPWAQAEMAASVATQCSTHGSASCRFLSREPGRAGSGPQHVWLTPGPRQAGGSPCGSFTHSFASHFQAQRPSQASKSLTGPRSIFIPAASHAVPPASRGAAS